jgi:hypothetical protein
MMNQIKTMVAISLIALSMTLSVGVLSIGTQIVKADKPTHQFCFEQAPSDPSCSWNKKDCESARDDAIAAGREVQTKCTSENTNDNNN